MYGILFVCTGNICRSPTAEGIFRLHAARAGLAGRLRIDSAGTHDYHIGEPPDPRSQRAAKTRGADISRLRARQLDADDFRRFDLILTMDAYNEQCVDRVRPPDAAGRVLPFLHYAPDLGAAEVPDPFYGGPEGFEHVLDLIEAASAGLVAELRRSLADDRGAVS